MSIESPNLYDPEEMALFGFDPASDLDKEEWLKTTPPNGIPAVVDYSDDGFEFGSPQIPSSELEQ